MHLLGLDAKELSGPAGNPGKQLRQIVGVEPVQRAPQTVIVELICRNSCSKPSARPACSRKIVAPNTTAGNSTPIH
jgi:hypothetical protein